MPAPIALLCALLLVACSRPASPALLRAGLYLRVAGKWEVGLAMV